MTPRRITIVASELLGRAGTGGAGTADSLLAVALGRHGHQVELLIASGREIGPLDADWTRIYASAGVDVRVLERLPGVRPAYHAPTLEVYRALRERPPEVVIADDWRGLAFAALRARQLGMALQETAFVVHCHGPARVLAAFADKVPDTLARFGEEVMERASIELADAVVSPSEWLLDWMRAHGWPVPAGAKAIPLVRQSVALDDAPALAPAGHKVARVAFFGQLREGKGIRIFLAALEALEPALLDGIEVLFLGAESKRWPRDRILTTLSSRVQSRLAAVRIETRLPREAALDELVRPGTLAVMPSLLDNSPNTVSECIEHGVPFIATRVGGIPELVAEDDRARVLCDPTVESVAAVLRAALASDSGFAPARAPGDPRRSLDAWLQVVESATATAPAARRTATGVAVIASSDDSEARAQRLAATTQSVEVEVVRADSRRDGLMRTAADWVVFLDDDDVPDDSFLDSLVAAQAASNADLVTAAVRPADDPGGIHLFVGDPGALGLVENQYGVVGLLRSELAAAAPLSDSDTDPDWPLFARIALSGARIVSAPEALGEHTRRPGRVGDVPGEGLAVLEAFEEHRAGSLPDLPQLAATLAAAKARLPESPPQVVSVNGPVERVLRVFRTEGVAGLARRARPRRGRP